MNKSFLIIVLFVYPVLLSWAQTNELVFEAYPISSPQPDDIIAAARMLVGDKGKMVYDKVSNKLLVYAPKKEHALIAELLGKAVPTGINIQIDVTVDEAEDATTSKASVSATGTYKKGSDGKSKTEIKIKPEIEARSSVKTGRTIQTLVVSDGNAAAIDIGTDVPFSDWIIEFGRHWGYIQQNIKYRRLGASLRILPRVIDTEKGVLSIKLIPEISALHEKEDDFTTIQFVNVSTELIVRDGETITFGGSSNNKEFYDKFLIGISREGIRKRMQITLTPHLIKTNKTQ